VTILGKGRKTRSVTLNYKALRAIVAYLKSRPAADCTHVFLSKFRSHLSPRAIQNVITKYVGLAAIPHATPHTLRHTFATHHIKKGTGLKTVQQALGHASLKTTEIYVHLAREVMDKELQRNAL
jgi:site-specific recombinase XerD